MITDAVRWNTLERITSDDLNNAQELGRRLTSELAQCRARAFATAAAAAPTQSVRTHLASGLAVQQSGGATVIVNPGMLCQSVPSSPPDVPTPEALDSSYRVGLNLAALDATDPWDATGSFWLLEGRVVRTTTLSEVRDIYDPATSTFAPSAAAIDKRYEAQVEVQWVKDPVSFATQLPAGTAGWAPLAGCWRPAGGGNIFDADVFNLSVQLSDVAQYATDEGNPVRLNYRLQSEAAVLGGGVGTAADGFSHDFAAIVQGLHCFARSEDGQITDFHHARIVELASAAALQVADVWGYVYLAPLADRMPSGLYPNVHHRGCLIVSRVAPDYHGRNSAPITAPAPLVENIDTGMAAHIGVVRSAGPATWVYTQIGSGGEGQCQEKQFNNNNFPLTSANGFVGPAGPPSPQIYNFGTTGPGGTEDVPYGVQLKCFANHTAINTAAVAEVVEIQFVFPNDSGVFTDRPRLLMSCRTGHTAFFEIAPRIAADLGVVTVSAQERNAAMGAAAPASGAGNDFVAGIWGFRF